MKKMMENWEVLIEANIGEEEMCKEVDEREIGDESWRYLNKYSNYFDSISEEVEKIEEGKADEKKAYAFIRELISEIEKEIEKEKIWRNRGHRNFVDYWENVLKIVEEIETEEAETSNDAEYEEEERKAELEQRDIGEVEEVKE